MSSSPVTSCRASRAPPRGPPARATGPRRIARRSSERRSTRSRPRSCATRRSRRKSSEKRAERRTMLTDSQIERYSRQIVLPEVGSRGQERLLAASAEIGGGGSAAIFCAAHLEAAGVGNLHVEAIGAHGPLADALGLHVRNVDCVIGSTSFAKADVTILFGKVDPARAA